MKYKNIELKEGINSEAELLVTVNINKDFLDEEECAEFIEDLEDRILCILLRYIHLDVLSKAVLYHLKKQDVYEFLLFLFLETLLLLLFRHFHFHVLLSLLLLQYFLLQHHLLLMLVLLLLMIRLNRVLLITLFGLHIIRLTLIPNGKNLLNSIVLNLIITIVLTQFTNNLKSNIMDSQSKNQFIKEQWFLHP